MQGDTVNEPNKIAAKDARGQWIILSDVPGEAPARVQVTRVDNQGHGMVKLTMPKHPTLGSWSATYANRHMLTLAPAR